MIFFGIATFAYIQNSVMDYKKVKGLESGLLEQEQILEDFLAQIDGVIPDKKLSNYLYDHSMSYMK